MKFGVLIFFLCLSTYLPRMLPALFMNKIQVSGRLATFLQLIPYTAMASLIFPAILYVDENMWIGIVASVVAVMAASKKLPVIGVVLSSVIACLLLYSLSQKCKIFTIILKALVNGDIILLASKGSFKKFCVNRNLILLLPQVH